MRKTCLKAMIAGLALAGWAVGMRPASGQQPVYLMPITNVWRYNQGNTNPLPTWKNPGFSEESIWEGPDNALFYVEETTLPAPKNTSLNLQNNGSQNMAYYFRTHFIIPTFPVALSNVTITASNLIDDGAVIYLNGQEAARIGMAAGAVNYTTAANRTVGDATTYDVVNLPTTNLHSGDNVIAVEVHQASSTSSDIVWGCSLTAIVPTRIVITNQPDSQTVVVGTRVNLTVGVSGSNPQYRWYKNGVLVSGGTSPTLTFASIQPSHAGSYYVVVSNFLNTVTSQTAVLTVIADTFPPELISAVVKEGDTNKLTISFNEAPYYMLDASRYYTNPIYRFSSANPFNYCVQAISGTNVTKLVVQTNIVTGIDTGTGLPTVRLTTMSNFVMGTEYVLTVSNLMDPRSNILAYAQIGVQFQFTTNLFDIGQVWNYTFYDMTGSNWTASNFNEDWQWGTGGGPLFFMETTNENCYGQFSNLAYDFGTPISILDRGTYYFRTKFMVPTNLDVNVAVIRFTNVVDDGAAFYLNGVELPGTRFNLPAGPLAYLTPASTAITNNLFCRGFTLTATNLLVPGTNLFTAEVHQYTDTVGFDVFFGGRLDLSITTAGLVIPELTCIRYTNLPGRIVVNWQGGTNYKLEAATDLKIKNWTYVTNRPPYTNMVPSQGARYYRLKRP